MNAYNFEIPSRQSIKGIVVIFGVSAFQIVKGSWVFVLLFILKFLQSGKGPDLSNPWIAVLGSGILILILTIAILQFINFKFYLKDGYFFLKKGILNKEEISVSTLKIQNVYIKQNLLQQLINVVSLSIETAGDDKTEIMITALTKPKALALKSRLLENASKNENSVITESTDQIYFKASFTKLLLEGISENHLKSFLLIFAFLMGLYNDVKEFVNSVGFMEGFRDWFKLDGESVMAIVLLNLTFVAVMLVVSMLFSMVKILVQNFNLTVLRSEKGLEISKGLFNKINLGLTSSRIQKTTISTNRLKKALGLYKLSFTQANTNKKQQQNFNIVGLNKTQVTELLNQFYPSIDDRVVTHKPNRYMLFRMLYYGFLILIVLNVGLYFLPIQFQWLNVFLFILIGGNAWFIYKKAYYFLDEEYIVRGGGGLIDTYTSFLELHKTQSVQIKQTYFQRRRGLANLIIHSASKSLTIPHISKSEAFYLSNCILYLVESQNKDWM